VDAPNESSQSAVMSEKIDSVGDSSGIAAEAKCNSESQVDGNVSSTKKPMQKAKLLRIARRRDKLLAKGIDPDSVLTKKQVPLAKSLEDFLSYGEKKRNFEVKTVKVGSKEFRASFDLEHSLYLRYQMAIHNDDEDDCTASQFRRFLCDSPLNDEDDDGEFFGSYHQQYYIDKELIAVGVIDILPECVSSVYFFYSPNYMQLSPGTFGALKEIAFTRELNKTCPTIQYYYLGFYIHSCTKMRYKGSFNPSYLLCPEEYTWHKLDDNVRNRLTASRYCRLSSTSKPSQAVIDVKSIPVLHKRKLTRYDIYHKATSSTDTKDVQEYADLLGPICAKRIVLYRH